MGGTWTTDEVRRLRQLVLDPVQNTRKKLRVLVEHFNEPGASVFAVTEGTAGPCVSKGLARKVRDLTRQGRLDWLIEPSQLSDDNRRAQRELITDPLLVGLRKQHLAELCEVASQLRGEVSVPRPDAEVRDTANRLVASYWRVGPKGKCSLPVEDHELYCFLKQHLGRDEVWVRLEALRAQLPVYRQQCKELLKVISSLAVDKSYADCPIADPREGRFPCISHSFGGSVYYEVVNVAMGYRGLDDLPYEPNSYRDGIKQLAFSGWGIAWAHEADLDHLEAAHRKLQCRLLNDPRPKELVAGYRDLGATASQARARLEPNLVRQIVYRGVCDLCP